MLRSGPLPELLDDDPFSRTASLAVERQYLTVQQVVLKRFRLELHAILVQHVLLGPDLQMEDPAGVPHLRRQRVWEDCKRRLGLYADLAHRKARSHLIPPVRVPVDLKEARATDQGPQEGLLVLLIGPSLPPEELEDLLRSLRLGNVIRIA